MMGKQMMSRSRDLAMVMVLGLLLLAGGAGAQVCSTESCMVHVMLLRAGSQGVTDIGIGRF